MEFPIKAFEIKGFNDEYIKLEIVEVYGYPHERSFRGGYDIKCNLAIRSGVYFVKTNNYYSATGAVQNFYVALKKRYNDLNGKAAYEVYFPDNDLVFGVDFKDGKATVTGKYRDDLTIKNVLEFEFYSDQSYFSAVLRDLKAVIELFG